jgi:hypothetical protein
MITTVLTLLATAFLATAANPPAQTTQTTQPTPPAQKRPVAPRTASVRISVHDDAGTALPDVRLSLSGGATGEFTTGAAGTAILPNLKPGMYRVRAEHEGHITLEREFTLGTGAWNPIELVLTAAPPPPPSPPPKPAAPAAAAAPPPGGAPVAVSIPDFLDKNFIGRDPIKESVLACKPFETVRLLQLREPLAPHVHERADEIIYVVAGEGLVRIGDEETALRPGMVVVVPNAKRHGYERRGKNPLVLVSTLAGTACEAPR